MNASSPSVSFDDVEPHCYLPVNARTSVAGACELVLARPGDFADALEWLNEEYSEAAVAGRALQGSERTYKLGLWDLRHRRDRYQTFPRRMALRAADPRRPESRRRALLVKFYSVDELAHLTPEFIVHLSKHPEAVRDWVVKLTVEGLGGARLRDGQIILSNDRREGDVVVDAANVEAAWKSMDERCRETIRHLKAERQQRDARIREQVKERGGRLLCAVRNAAENGLPAGREEGKHARRLVLLACLLTYQHELTLAGEFGSWQWESEGSMFAQLAGGVYVPGRESALFNPAYRRGERFDASCLNVPDFDGFTDLVGRALRILQRANDAHQSPVTALADARQTKVLDDFRRLCRFMTALIVNEIPPEVQASRGVEVEQGHNPTPGFMLWRETRRLAEQCITDLAEIHRSLAGLGTLTTDRIAKLDNVQNALADLIGSISNVRLPKWPAVPEHSERLPESGLERLNNDMAVSFDGARATITRFTDWLNSVGAEPARAASNQVAVIQEIAEATGGAPRITAPIERDNAHRHLQAAPGAGKSWQSVQKAAEAHCVRNPFPGVKALAKIIGCSPSTMSKAIERSTKLRAALALRKSNQTSVSSVKLSDQVAESMEQTREPDPVDKAAESTDELFQRLIEQANPEERAKLHAMTPDRRRELVATCQHDPDEAEQQKLHRRAKRRSH